MDDQAKPNKKTVDNSDKKSPNTSKSALKEKLVRYPATVITTSGYDKLALRGTPSIQGLKVSTVMDGDEMQVCRNQPM